MSSFISWAQHIAQHTTQSMPPIYVSIWDSIDPKFWSEFGADGIPNTEMLWKKYRTNSKYGVIGLRVFRNTTHSVTPTYVSNWDFIDLK